MLEELKKPVEELLSAGKNAALHSNESEQFFEKLSEKFSIYTGRTIVENTELKYNKNYDPEEKKE